MPTITRAIDDIISIAEICYRVHRTRGQVFIWRGLPGFPEPLKTKYGHIGYSWSAVVAWMAANQHWMQRRAGDPDIDVLVASDQASSPGTVAEFAPNAKVGVTEL